MYRIGELCSVYDISCFRDFYRRNISYGGLVAQSLGNEGYHAWYDSSPVPQCKSFHLGCVPKGNRDFLAQGPLSDGAKRHKNLKQSELST